LLRACRNQQDQIVVAVGEKAEPTIDGDHPLRVCHQAIELGQQALMDALLAGGPDGDGTVFKMTISQ
jgi:hypothetical protein